MTFLSCADNRQRRKRPTRGRRSPAIAYSLILKDVGVLIQTFYLMATDMRLGGCAIGITNIDLFAKMTGIEFHVEGPVGQFAIGRGAKSGASD